MGNTSKQEVRKPCCPPESRCAICWDNDDTVIEALVAERDRLRAALKRVELHYSIESLTAGEARNMARDMRDIAREALREESRDG